MIIWWLSVSVTQETDMLSSPRLVAAALIWGGSQQAFGRFAQTEAKYLTRDVKILAKMRNQRGRVEERPVASQWRTRN